MKRKWWILIIVVVLLIWLGIAWYLLEPEMLVDDEKSECQKEYERCLEQEAMWVYIDCIPCWVLNYIE